MDNRRNFYRILRVQPDASSQVIQQSYRSLMQNLRLHPDLGGEHWDASIINQAYATLRDAKKRADYDVDLLRRYNIVTLSRGGSVMACGSYVRDDSKTSQQVGNQRNYYRVLHVQPDAELAVINASYRTLHGQLDGDKQQQLADEAFRVIGDMRLRAQYDALLKSDIHVTCVKKLKDFERLAQKSNDNVMPPLSRHEYGGELGTVPETALSVISQTRIRHYCKFCKTPYFNDGLIALDNVCEECASPLSSPADIAVNTLGRSLARMQQSESVSIYEYWPSQPVNGLLEDLSLTGLSFSASQSFDIKQIIKVDGSRFKAVAEVAHCRNLSLGNSVGVKFLTIEFLRTTGSFVSTFA